MCMFSNVPHYMLTFPGTCFGRYFCFLCVLANTCRERNFLIRVQNRNLLTTSVFHDDITVIKPEDTVQHHVDMCEKGSFVRCALGRRFPLYDLYW